MYVINVKRFLMYLNPLNLHREQDSSKHKQEGSTHQNVQKEHDKPELIYILIGIIAICVGYIHSWYVETLFENDRHFSHLSDLEREMTFRSEMGLYYSYYKTIVEAPTFLSGLDQIMNDNLTEYPNKINTLRRFNLSPEVMIGLLYRVFMNMAEYFGIQTKVCWQIERGEGLHPVSSCEGIGVPVYYYLSVVWTFAGVTMAFIFLYGVTLTGNPLGGLLSVAWYFFNHGECTRIQWTPTLRESFAYPLLLIQMYCVTNCLCIPRTTWKWRVTLIIVTALTLLFWQFSQFVILVQVAILYFLFAIGLLQKNILGPMLIAISCGVMYSCIILLGNEMLVTSFLSCTLIVVLLSLFLWDECLQRSMGRITCSVARLSLTGALILLLKVATVKCLGAKDDAHIFHLLQSKMTSYKDFDTLLYTCSEEFDFLNVRDLFQRLCGTLLVPVAGFVLCVLVASNFCGLSINENEKSKGRRETSAERKHAVKVDLPVLFNVLLVAVFFVMALLVMRLKLFFTPHLIIISSLIASEKFSIIRKQAYWLVIPLLLAGTSIQGFSNIGYQLNIMGEYSDPALEELLVWIKTETNPNSVFAGPMPTMANVLLSTRRPVVNHPHYEDAGLRERTKQVYSIFSRRTCQEVYRTMASIYVNYVVIHQANCLWKSSSNCSMVDIWDVEQPELRNKPALCPQLFKQNPSPFQRVFSNEEYVVLWLPTQYVELVPKQYSS